MLKKILFLYFFYIFYLLELPLRSERLCDFKTSDYIASLNSPYSIKKINIKVPQSKKYVSNQIKALLNSSTARGAISKKYKKKFRAKIEVLYPFGSCSYSGKIWQNGDWKDHIQYKDGNLTSSINIKLDSGNIMNATKFKLLLPSTRNGVNEILATVILKNLSFITPETFEVLVGVNNNDSIMIFQEDSQKELLERNFRREGPIYEGDETLIWTPKQYEINENVGGGGLEAISLSRLINKNWFLKGRSSQHITMNSINKLQKSYLRYSDQYPKSSIYIEPNNYSNDIFTHFNFLMIAMGGDHALRPHNRKYYFNSLNNEFEPIYYDGDITFKLSQINKSLNQLRFDNNYLFPYHNLIKDPTFFKKIKSEYFARVLNLNQKKSVELNKKFNSFVQNTRIIQNKILEKNFNYKPLFKENKEYRKTFLDRNKNYNIEKYIVKNFSILEDKVNIKLENGERLDLNLADFARVLSRKKVNSKLYLFLPKNNQKRVPSKTLIKKIPDIDLLVTYPINSNIEYKNIQNSKKLFIYQNSSKDSITLIGKDISDLEIIFFGLNNSSENLKSEQRFNKRGLTGCLNIYNSNFKNLSIKVNGGECEDSLNIINSKGTLSKVNVENSYQDAIDLDFSSIKIKNLSINNSGNDCLDVSSGNYILDNANLNNCSDKGISIGEKSSFEASKININKSNIGIAIKDYSNLIGKNITILNTKTCVESFQKKQEFGGAYAEFIDINCNGEFINDNQSTIKIIK